MYKYLSLPENFGSTNGGHFFGNLSEISKVKAMEAFQNHNSKIKRSIRADRILNFDVEG